MAPKKSYDMSKSLANRLYHDKNVYLSPEGKKLLAKILKLKK
ncbi:hypothetical protein [Gracilibacillus xinjiangensis]|uniref:Fur-regulated basic protein FbpA n=1 Tax=Gracilibacillus xinjiangensis TaxID=1193282 RepID=A0ABV8WRL0_9BACI